MQEPKKVLTNITIYALAIYLLLSAIIITCYVDFGTPPSDVGLGFSEEENVIRMMMGLPATYNTYKGVPPIYLVSSSIRLILSVVLFVFGVKLQIRWKMESYSTKN